MFNVVSKMLTLPLLRFLFDCEEGSGSTFDVVVSASFSITG